MKSKLKMRKRRKKQKHKLIKYTVIFGLLVIIVSGCFYAYSNLYDKLIGSGIEVNQTTTEVNIDEINKTIVTNLEVKDSITSQDMEIDSEIEKELDNKNNTFENPLVIQDPFDVAPLTAIAVFNTDVEAEIQMTIFGDTEADTFKYKFSKALQHRIPIIGLYAGRENRVILEEIVDGKVKDTKELKIQTEALPENLQNIVEVTSSKGEAVPGITIVSGQNSTTPYAFDSSGAIRWYVKVKTEGHGYFPMSNGRFMLMNAESMLPTEKRPYNTQLYDMDFLGRVHNIYNVPNGAHHDIVEKTPNGNLLVLSNSLEGHVEDMVVELDRGTGKVVKELKLSNVLKNTDYDETSDWAHINAVSYNAEDNSIMLSVRNLSSVVKIDWSTNELKWILSDPKVWEGTEYEKYVLKAQGDTVWHYEQHAAYPISEDIDNNPKTLDIMLFDNRVVRNPLMNIKVEEEAGKSSVTQYAVNEKNKTVTQVKRFPNTLSYITSNYQLFYDEDSLVANHGSVIPAEGQNSIGEIYEYKYSSGEVVRSYKTKYSFYRAYRQDFDFESASKAMDSSYAGSKGELAPLIKESENKTKSILKAPKELSMWISENTLYINMPNLSVKKVEFIGDGGTWSRNLISNYSSKLYFARAIARSLIKGSLLNINYKYNVAIPLDNLPKGKYSINVDYYGVNVNTGAEIEIK